MGIPLSLEYGAEWDESYALLSISPILQLVAFPDCVFFLPSHTRVLSERSRSEKTEWQLAEEKELLYAISPKFKNRASEA
ncbi:hypothetical protein SAMN02745702_02595 [Desulfobaculum bizertense DSM 18034]|uniref:Uncharacterized protein n=1 Tax=Desulfobaculum bizertense DSM 18034 TaxID=1121442 RepID=A0A1T4WTM3_9BACT|nr:hypothetical protein SAMN02745702_02595 [Desulfobaculum bizertense DSM 18034]